MNESADLQKVVEGRMANIKEAIESANTENYNFLLLMCVKTGELGPCDTLRVFGCSNATQEINIGMVKEFMAVQPKPSNSQSNN